MGDRKKILLVGESWHVHTTESKGFDVFSYDYYEEATGYIKAALEGVGMEFVHIPSHMVEYSFPKTAAELAQYDVVMFSDVGANTMNLPMDVFMRLHPTTNKLEILREYVEQGGAFVMIGGYLSFQGIQARGAYKNTPVEELLPVELLPGDDRVEKSQGVRPEVCQPQHPAVQGLPGEWPVLLGYNKLIPKEEAEVPVTVNGDPLVVLGEYGKGRTCAFATDCAPHWAPVEFCTWQGYAPLWKNLVDWLTK
ncbi:cytoplasmic protein [Anaerofilum sp. BX8]|uniref:Cytoplasmic protein n=1 Tax=Anaerofilum hominis TaxID=2763016 RepID=A0A923I5H1_9FIRM|nr:glutamine amidotransferase [Anaerofilum hominis]MBC5580129.1 cytoplasmic protein [Anaerofilum hominis]